MSVKPEISQALDSLLKEPLITHQLYDIPIPEDTNIQHPGKEYLPSAARPRDTKLTILKNLILDI